MPEHRSCAVQINRSHVGLLGPAILND